MNDPSNTEELVALRKQLYAAEVALNEAHTKLVEIMFREDTEDERAVIEDYFEKRGGKTG